MIQIDPNNATHGFLQLLAGFHAKTEMPLNPYQWLIDNGADYQYAPLPKRMRRGPMKHCYWNSMELVRRGKGRFVYCEGVAASIIPVDHAWCIDRETGRVVDRTWQEGSCYVGVPIRLKYVQRCLEIEAPVLMNWREDYPIVTGEVPVEVWREEIR